MIFVCLWIPILFYYIWHVNKQLEKKIAELEENILSKQRKIGSEVNDLLRQFVHSQMQVHLSKHHQNIISSWGTFPVNYPVYKPMDPIY